ncbi:hypothetical protein WUBG_15160, partial [Wuchereria bancrofti]
YLKCRWITEVLHVVFSIAITISRHLDTAKLKPIQLPIWVKSVLIYIISRSQHRLH